MGSGGLEPVRSLAITPGGTVISGSSVPKLTSTAYHLLPNVGHLPHNPKDPNPGVPMFLGDRPWRSASEGLKFWRADGKEDPAFALSGPLTKAPPDRISLSRDGKTLAAGGPDGSVWLWELDHPNRQPRRLFDSPETEQQNQAGANFRLGCPVPSSEDPVQGLDISPDGRALAVAYGSGRLTLWDLAGSKARRNFPDKQSRIQWLRFSPDGKTLASNAGGQVRLWDAHTAQLLKTLGKVEDSPSMCGAFAPDGSLLVSGTSSKGIRAWELATEKERPPLVGHLGRVSSVAFAPDGKTLASGSWDRNVIFWNVPAWQQVAFLDGHQSHVTCLTFAPDGKMLFSGSDTVPGKILCWRALAK